jgi:hypothetical protein
MNGPDTGGSVARVEDALDLLKSYRKARHAMLEALGLADSNRDPIAEFSEHFVATLMGGMPAANRVQPRWDVELPNGQLVQVKYLANPAGRWVNEHRVASIDGVDWYVVVLFEAFDVVGVAGFPSDLAEVCRRLGKRHGDQDRTLQFTRRNWLSIRESPQQFVDVGMRVWLPSFDGEARSALDRGAPE